MKKLLFIILVLAMSTTTFFGQDSKKIPTSTPQNNEVAQMSLAQQLADYAYANNDPISLISAAQIVSTMNVRQFTPESMESKGVEVDRTKTAITANLLDLEKMLKDAKEMAKGDKTIIALADKVTKDRGRSGGPAIEYESVNASSSDYYNVRFNGGEVAMVVVSGDGDTDLDLYIYDQYGHLVTKDTDLSDDCVVRWVPEWTQTYKIKVKNLGSVYNSYAIGTN